MFWDRRKCDVDRFAHPLFEPTDGFLIPLCAYGRVAVERREGSDYSGGSFHRGECTADALRWELPKGVIDRQVIILVMKALSLTRPWPFAFLNGPERLRKRIENRTWRPPDKIIGRQILLHAAKSWDENGREFISKVLGVPVPDKRASQQSVLFARCTVEGSIESWDQSRFFDCLGPEQEQWFFGPHGWILSDLIAIPRPIFCTGRLGLWDVPASLWQNVKDQLD